MRVRRDTDRLFRRRPAPSRLLARAVVVGTRERHIPGVTPRRVAVEVALLALLVSGSWLVPPTVGSPVAHDAMASRRPTDVAETPPAAALPPEALPLPPPPARPAALGPAAGPPGAPRLPLSRTRAGRALLLTFDDGPDPRYTPGILALLEAYDARAVFCVVGQEALEHPDLVRAIVAAGHDLCNHSTHHDMTLATRPGPVIRADLVRTQAILRGITGGVVPRLMRAPGGRWSPTLVAEAEALSLEPLSWSVDSRDWSKPGLREIVARVLGDAQPGGVVLMHDGGGDRSRTLVALPFLLRRLSQLGYAFR